MKRSTLGCGGAALAAMVATVLLIQALPARPVLWHVLLLIGLLAAVVFFVPLSLLGLGRTVWLEAGRLFWDRQDRREAEARLVAELEQRRRKRVAEARRLREAEPVADGQLPPPEAAPAGDGYERPKAGDAPWPNPETLVMPVVDAAALDAYHATAVASLAEPAPETAVRIGSHRGRFHPDDVPPSQRVRDTAAAPWLPTAAVMVPTPPYGYDAMANARNASAAAT